MRRSLASCFLLTAFAVPAVASECAPIDNVDTIAGRKVIFVGELHGTAESPQFVGALACRMLQRGGPVALALEMPIDFQADLDAAMSDGDAQSARARLDRIGFWDAAVQDGRRSRAWLALLESAWQLKREHAGFSVVAVDAPRGVRAAEREAYIAGRIREIAQANPKGSIVVLGGNLHARRIVGTPWNKTFEPAAYLLRDLDMVSLNVAYVAGTAWNCTQTGCGVQPVSREPVSGRKQIPKIQLAPGDGAYDGTYELGEVTASLPVRTERAASGAQPSPGQ